MNLRKCNTCMATTSPSTIKTVTTTTSSTRAPPPPPPLKQMNLRKCNSCMAYRHRASVRTPAVDSGATRGGRVTRTRASLVIPRPVASFAPNRLVRVVFSALPPRNNGHRGEGGEGVIGTPCTTFLRETHPYPSLILYR